MPDITQTSYDNTKVVAGGDVTAHSQLPTDINMPTQLAVASVLRSVENNTTNVSDATRNTAATQISQQAVAGIDAALSNFKPKTPNFNSAPTKVSKPKTPTTPAGNSSARQVAMAGLDPITKGIAEQTKALTALLLQKQQLLQQTDSLKNQIDGLTAQLIAATTAGNLEQLRLYEALIDDIQKKYDAAAATLDAIHKAWINRDKILKKLREDRDKLEKKIDDNLDDLEKKYNSIQEIPLAITFPSFPKLPALNLTKASFKQVLSNLKTTIIAAAKNGAKKSLEQASKESQPKIDTGKDQDQFQKAASGVRDAIMQVRQTAQAAIDAKNAATVAATNVLKDQITMMQQQAAVMEAGINDTIDTAALRIDANIKSVRSTVSAAQQTVANVTNTVQNTVTSAQNALNSVTSRMG